jgi:hypothetical protein
MRRPVALTTLLFFATLCVAADTERFSHIKIHRHRSVENRVLVDKLGKLTFDDAKRKLIFEKTVEDKFDVPERVEVGYDSAPKVVFEVTTHMRGGAATYYFLQNTFQGVFKWETKLSHNSAELVTYLMSGTYFSDWSRK